jgi:hypothetical protein
VDIFFEDSFKSEDNIEELKNALLLFDYTNELQSKVLSENDKSKILFLIFDFFLIFFFFQFHQKKVLFCINLLKFITKKKRT